MKKSDEDFIKNWEAWKKRGRITYTLVVGLPFAIILCIFNVWNNNEGNGFSEVISDPKTWRTVAIYFVFGMVVYAQIMWWYNDRLYRKKLKKYAPDNEQLN